MDSKAPEMGRLTVRAINSAAAVMLCKGGSYQMSRAGAAAADRQTQDNPSSSSLGTRCHVGIKQFPFGIVRYRMKDSSSSNAGVE